MVKINYYKGKIMKKIIALSAIAGMLILTGCGDTTEEDGFNEDAPVITLQGDKNIEITLGTRTVNEPGFSATDPQDGDLTQMVHVTNDINLDSAGIYTVSYDVMDSDGLTATATRTVTIVDPNDNSDNNVTIFNGGQTYKGAVPEITFPGGNPLYLSLGEQYDTRYTARDLEDGDLGQSVNIEGSDFNINQTGTYSVTYTVTDSDNNTVTKVRTVYVGNYEAENDTSTWSDNTWNDTTPSDLDNFISWYKETCGQTFHTSLYNENTGRYNGEISCSNRGLNSIDLTTLSIFSSINSVDFSHNNLDYIDLSPFNNTNIIEIVRLNHNNFTYIDFSPLTQLQNINELWINNNNLDYSSFSARDDLYKQFNNKSLFIGF